MDDEEFRELLEILDKVWEELYADLEAPAEGAGAETRGQA